MRPGFLLMMGMLALSAVAEAQTSAPPPDRGYAEGFIQSAFGNVTSQSYGAEVGIAVTPFVQVFVEGGRTRDVAGTDIGSAAQQVAAALAQTQSAVSYTVKQPVTFVDAGIKYNIPIESTKVQPYAIGGFGIAQVKQDVTFTVNGTDVTSNLQQYGVVLGSDLSGSSNKALLVLGAGATVPVWHQLVADLQFRYGRIFSDPGINMSRAGIGLGVRF
jgi:opacity protein-like surface antigen